MRSLPHRLFGCLFVLVLIACPALGDEPWTRQRKGVAIPMRDGEVLIADVYLPESPARYPTILVQTP
jgi:predicted acyl esterase